MDGLVAAHATTLVLAAATGSEGYDARPVLDAKGWATLLGNLDRLDVAASARGLEATLHPHVGTMVESGEETERVLRGSGIGLCLDTGHLLIGGGDPVAVARRSGPGGPRPPQGRGGRRRRPRPPRGTELHRRRPSGMYRPLGAGDVDVAAIVTSLENAGYAGWYVLEQDTILDAVADRGQRHPGAGGGCSGQPGPPSRRCRQARREGLTGRVAYPLEGMRAGP